MSTELPEGIRLVRTNTRHETCDYCIGSTKNRADNRPRCADLPWCGNHNNFMDDEMFAKWVAEQVLT